ncbi:MAG: AraC family transcriptional regulator [Verrucomicrobiae bacterium]
MTSSGVIPRNSKLPKAALEIAHTGASRFHTTRWTHHCLPYWVLDEINQGRQKQRIGKGKVFTRLSGLAAFYAPGCEYHEWQSDGGSLRESFMVFSAWGDLEMTLRRLVGRRGWCHILDPEHLIGDRLQHLGDLVFRRRPGFGLLAHAAMLELLGMLVVAPRVGPTRFEVRAETWGRKRDLVQSVEGYVRDHVAEPLSVVDLAVHLKMSLPTFSRTYPRVAGETPGCTVRRLKVEAAKRLLLGERLGIKECALRLGFSSEFHFSRLFKRLEGLPPSEYVDSLSRGRSA